MNRPCLNNGGPSSRILLSEVPTLGSPVPVNDAMLPLLDLWQALPGEVVSTIDPEGGVWRARRDDLKGRPVLVPCDKMEASPESFLQLHLYQALSCRESFEQELERATELGVKRIIPFVSQCSNDLKGKISAEETSRHWTEILLRTAKRCRRVELPELAPVVDWDSAIYDASHADLKILLFEGDCRWHLREVLRDENPHRIALMVGPEVGFSPEEIAEVQQFGFLPVTLGSRLLSPAVAALAAIALIQSQLGDLG